MNSFLESIDFYGEPYTFTIFQDAKFQTKIGGIMTIFTILGFIFSFVYFGRDFFFRLNPSYLNQKITLDTYPEYTINNSNLIGAVQIEDNSGNYFNYSRYLDILLVHQYFNLFDPNNGSSSFYIQKDTKLSFTNCSNVDIDGMNLHQKRDLNNSMCIDFQNYQLGGYWDSDKIKQININVIPCRNDTSKNKTDCYSLPVIYDYFLRNKIWFAFYTNFYYTKLDNYDYPLESTLFNIDMLIMPDFRKVRRIFYKMGNISSDMGIVTKMPKDYSLYGYEFYSFDFTNQYPAFLNATNKTILIQYSLLFNANVEFFNISYIKLQHLIADTGGFLTFFNYFSLFFTSIFNNHLKQLKLINKVFNYSDFKNNSVDKLIEMNFPKKIIKRKKTFKTTFSEILGLKKKREKEEIKEQNDALFLKQNESKKFNLNLENNIQVTAISPEMNIRISPELQTLAKNDDKIITKTKENFHNYYNNLKEKRHFLFDISFCLLYKFRICPSRLSKNEEFLMNLFIRSQNIVVKKMDVVEYLKFVFEYVNLKFVLFNDMNALCLQFANKPKLINSKEDKLSKKKVEKIEEIVRHFTRKNGDLSGEENKLYEILSDDVKELINAFK